MEKIGFDLYAFNKSCGIKYSIDTTLFYFDLEKYFELAESNYIAEAYSMQQETEFDLVYFVYECLQQKLERSECFKQQLSNGLSADVLLVELVEDYKEIFKYYAEYEADEQEIDQTESPYTIDYKDIFKYDAQDEKDNKQRTYTTEEITELNMKILFEGYDDDLVSVNNFEYLNEHLLQEKMSDCLSKFFGVEKTELITTISEEGLKTQLALLNKLT